MKIEKGKNYKCISSISNHFGPEFFREHGVYHAIGEGILKNAQGIRYYMTEPDFVSSHFKLYSDAESNSDHVSPRYDPETETRPSHYGGDTNPHEPIKIIQHYGLSFELGNVIKYVLRSDKKSQREADLRKAMQYLQFELNKLNK